MDAIKLSVDGVEPVRLDGVSPKKWFELYPVAKIQLPVLAANYKEGVPDAAFLSHWLWLRHDAAESHPEAKNSRSF